MSKSYRISFEEHYLVVEVEGLANADRVIATSESILNSSEFKPGFPQIWDLTKADMSDASGEELEAVANALHEEWSKLKHSRVGLVSGHELNLTSMELFKEMYDHDFDNVRVFNNLVEAEAWITGREE